jgi:cardiolipin synthase
MSRWCSNQLSYAPVIRKGILAENTFAVPNLLSIARLVLIPVVAWQLAAEAYEIALPLFLAAALTDLADGFIARRFRLTSRLGALLDPVADKLTMLVTTLVLAWQSLVPLWLAAAIIARDVVIAAGALAYRRLLGKVDIAPTLLSKLNTVVEFAMLLATMAAAAGWLPSSRWLEALFAFTLATVLASGAQYVWVWGRKALAERRARG